MSPKPTNVTWNNIQAHYHLRAKYGSTKYRHSAERIHPQNLLQTLEIPFSKISWEYNQISGIHL